MANEPTMQYLYDQLQAHADAQKMTVYCLLCPKWKATGTAQVAKAASEAHRAKKHPELVGKKVIAGKRRRFSSAMSEEREAQIDEERRQRMRSLGLA